MVLQLRHQQSKKSKYLGVRKLLFDIDPYHVHHWRLNLKETEFVEELTNVRNDFCANIENISHSIVKD